MSRFASAIGVAIGTILASLLSHDGLPPWLLRDFRTGDTCSVEALGRAAAVDTAPLRRVKRESAPGRSAEGGRTTIYYDGPQPRVIVITYFGETGRSVTHYYLASPDQFLVQQEIIRYEEPITHQLPPVIASRQPSTLYVCGETLKDPISQQELQEIRGDLRAVLAPQNPNR